MARKELNNTVTSESRKMTAKDFMYAGAFAASWATQRELLEDEGGEFRGEHVDMKKHRWEC